MLADDRGMAAVEFALLAPLLLMILFGVVVFSLYLTTWLGVAQAAAEGARASVAGLDAGERQSLATQRVQAVIAGYAPLLDTSAVEITYPAAGAGLFSVRVSYPLTALDLAKYAPLAPVPAIAPARTATVTTGGY